jgi:hypothetical protein
VFPPTEPEDPLYKSTEKLLWGSLGREPTEDEVVLGIMKRSFDGQNKGTADKPAKPIEWKYEFNDGKKLESWFYEPSEDYRGASPDEVEAHLSGGARLGMH